MRTQSLFVVAFIVIVFLPLTALADGLFSNGTLRVQSYIDGSTPENDELTPAEGTLSVSIGSFASCPDSALGGSAASTIEIVAVGSSDDWMQFTFDGSYCRPSSSSASVQNIGTVSLGEPITLSIVSPTTATLSIDATSAIQSGVLRIRNASTTIAAVAVDGSGIDLPETVALSPGNYFVSMVASANTGNSGPNFDEGAGRLTARLALDGSLTTPANVHAVPSLGPVGSSLLGVLMSILAWFALPAKSPRGA